MASNFIEFDGLKFGQAVRKYMYNNRMTYMDITLETGVSHATLWRLFRGKVMFIDTILTMAKVCGLELEDYLIYRVKDNVRHTDIRRRA